MGNAAAQVVNAGLTLTLGAGNVFENVIGGSLGDTLIGNTLANSINGKAGNDRISGGSGNDELIGGTGDDNYRFDTDVANGTDTVSENVVGGGVDTLDFGSTTTRSVNVSLATAAVQVVNAGLSLSLIAPLAIENVVGGLLGDSIVGNSAANQLDGGGGGDTLTGAGGDDELNGGTGDDTYLFDTDFALGTDELNESVGAGTDLLSFASTTTRSLNLFLSSTILQTVNAGLSLRLNASNTFENVIGGALSDTIIGNGLANFLDGRSGNDFLTGSLGNDTLVGGIGDDTFRFDADLALGADTLNEAGGGIDTLNFLGTTAQPINLDLSNGAAQLVSPGFTLTLGVGTNFENVVGGSLGDNLNGNANANSINGADGNDTINGGNGADVLNGGNGIDLLSGGSDNDQLIGGANDDTYRFDTDVALGTDTIDESAGGLDTLNFSSTTTRSVTVKLNSAAIQVVNAGLSLILGANNTIENVMGGSQNDVLIGNSLANVFSGGDGNDNMTGGAGDDLYNFDSDVALGADVINESGGGIDTLNFSSTTIRIVSVNLSNAALQVINAGLSLTLGAGNTVENVIGGSLGDTLVGNTLANAFTGGPGNDSITGGAGDDTYVFDTDVALGADTLNEAGGGFDTLDFSLTSSRGIAVNLSQAGIQVINVGLSLILGSATAFEKVIGGGLNDSITGNTLNNIILGGMGDDTILGGTGRDVLVGGVGADSIQGQGGDDLLISGSTTHDSNQAALRTVLAEWTNTAKNYNTRVTNLRAGVSGIRLQAAGAGATVFDDGASVDTMTGGTETDWYFSSAIDIITDLAIGELVDTLV